MTGLIAYGLLVALAFSPVWLMIVVVAYLFISYLFEKGPTDHETDN